MRTTARKLGAGLVVGLLAATLPATAAAQAPGNPVPDNTYSVDLYGGFDLPTQDLGDALDSGPRVALSFGRRLHGNVSLQLDLATSFYGETAYDVGRVGPTATMYRMALGPEVNLFDPKLTRWSLMVNAGFGWSFMSTDGLPDDCDAVCEVGPLVKTGVKLTYPVSGRVDAFAGAEGWWNFISDNRNGLLRRFEEQNPRELQDSYFSDSWTFPLIAGVRVNF